MDKLPIRVKDLTGQKFSKLTVINFSHTNKHQKSLWNCICECGNKKTVLSGCLINKYTTSCGCSDPTAFKSKVNQRYERLLVTKLLSYNGKGKIYYECLCDCGNVVIIEHGNLRKKRCKSSTLSCGCYFKDRVTGENNPHWNHKMSMEERENNHFNKSYPAYKKWRKEVCKKLDYTCQITGKKMSKENRICAHHLFSWHSNKELRFDINNGTIILKYLHILFHKIYGYKNNTREQFSEFVQRYRNKEFDNILECQKEHLQISTGITKPSLELIADTNKPTLN